MNTKLLNRNGIRLAQAATGISPADFPIGSLESRAAARALLEHADRLKPRLSDYDADALSIYHSAGRLLSDLKVSPGFLDIEGTAIYKRGEELAKQPVDETPTSKINRQETTTDSIEAIINNAFARARLPKLEYPVADREPFIWCVAYQLLLHIFQEAWERQLPSLPFPIKIEIDDDDGHLYLRQSSGEWREEIDKWSRRNILGPIEELKPKLEENGLIVKGHSEKASDTHS